MPNVRDYARILHDLAVRRALIHIGEDIVNTAYEAPHDKPPQAQIEEAEKALYRVAETSQYGEGPIDFAESLRRTVECAEKAQARGGTHFRRRRPALPTSIRCWAACSRPTSSSSPAVPAWAKPRSPPTWRFMPRAPMRRTWQTGVEMPRGAPVLFFSLEMAAQQLSARILSEQTEIEMWKIRNGKFSESEWENFVLKMQDLSTLPLYIDDTGGISIAQIAARARRLKREKKIGVVIIDHIQLVAPSRRAENRVQEITGDLQEPEGARQGARRSGDRAVAACRAASTAATTSGRCCPTCANPARSSRTPTW